MVIDQLGVAGTILLATVLDSFVGLTGIFSVFFTSRQVQKAVKRLVAFAAGALLGGALLHLLPEAAGMSPWSGELAAAGFLLFFLSERLINWRHCHKIDCDRHPMSWLIILGDGIHNFVDGLVIASSFLVRPALGWLATAAIIAHEVPQEIGDFAVLVHAGFSRERAIFWNLVSQSTCILGGLVGFLWGAGLEAFLVPLAAGGFLYIATVDIIPELHEEHPMSNFFIFLAGIALMEALKLLLEI